MRRGEWDFIRLCRLNIFINSPAWKTPSIPGIHNVNSLCESVKNPLKSKFGGLIDG
jgi:hypothetical protein